MPSKASIGSPTALHRPTARIDHERNIPSIAYSIPDLLYHVLHMRSCKPRRLAMNPPPPAIGASRLVHAMSAWRRTAVKGARFAFQGWLLDKLLYASSKNDLLIVQSKLKAQPDDRNQVT